MMIDALNNTLYKGDVIAISYNNDLDFGIFSKKGSSNNLNYITISQYNADRISKGNKPYTSYINTERSSRYIKIFNIGSFPGEKQQIISTIQNYLLNGYIK